MIVVLCGMGCVCCCVYAVVWVMCVMVYGWCVVRGGMRVVYIACVGSRVSRCVCVVLCCMRRGVGVVLYSMCVVWCVVCGVCVVVCAFVCVYLCL